MLLACLQCCMASQISGTASVPVGPSSAGCSGIMHLRQRRREKAFWLLRCFAGPCC